MKRTQAGTLVMLRAFIFCYLLFPTCSITKDQHLSSNKQQTASTKKQPKKEWTFVVYIAADNDLHSFADRNIAQMQRIGSSDKINVIFQISLHKPKQQKTTRRFIVEKNKLVPAACPNNISDSGSAESLIDCFKWATQEFPAENYALILWNHGTGIIDPNIPRTINPSELFSFNPSSRMVELNRDIGFLDFVNALAKKPEEQRGICFDESTRNYLTNQKLEYALKTICNKFLGGKKIGILGFDACLMSMLEIANLVKKYAHIMVGSQEVELGTGWDYTRVLLPFTNYKIDREMFAQHIVESYAATYGKVFKEYTQSAVDLDHIDTLEANVDRVAQLLLDSLQQQKNGSVAKTLKAARNKRACTVFDEPSYVDLHHFYSNLLNSINNFEFGNATKNQQMRQQLKKLLTEGCAIIDEVVIANKVGQKLKNAHGLSIYFPERRIHNSYRQTPFATSNAWSSFITKYSVA